MTWCTECPCCSHVPPENCYIRTAQLERAQGLLEQPKANKHHSWVSVSPVFSCLLPVHHLHFGNRKMVYKAFISLQGPICTMHLKQYHAQAHECKRPSQQETWLLCKAREQLSKRTAEHSWREVVVWDDRDLRTRGRGLSKTVPRREEEKIITLEAWRIIPSLRGCW